MAKQFRQLAVETQQKINRLRGEATEKAAADAFTFARNEGKVDLHHYQVSECEYILDQTFCGLVQPVIPIDVITGVGKHSPGNKAVLYPRVEEWLKLNHLKYKPIQGGFRVFPPKPK